MRFLAGHILLRKEISKQINQLLAKQEIEISIHTRNFKML